MNVEPERKTDKRASASPQPRSAGAVLWLIVLLAAVAAILSYKAVENRLDRELRLAALTHCSKLFPSARVTIDRVTIDGPSKIVIHGVRVATLDGKKFAQLLSIDRIELTGDLDIAHVVQDTIAVRRIDIYRPQADVWKLSNGQWSLEALACKNSSGKPTPVVEIHQGDVRVHRGARGAGTPILFHDCIGLIREGDVVQHTAQGVPIRRLEGKLSARSSGTCDSISLEGWHDRLSGKWFGQGRMESLNFSTDVVEKLPLDLAGSLDQLSGLSCKVSADIELEKSGPADRWLFRVGGKLFQGRFQTSRLPYPLDEMSGNFFCDNASLQLRDVKARSGQASGTFDADIRGFHPQAPVEVRSEVKMLQLDGRLYNALPPKWRNYWDRIQPEGYVDAKLQLSSDGRNWQPKIELLCRDVQMECWLFPYSLSKVVGRVIIERDRLTGIGLVGQAGGQPIAGKFNFARINEEWFGELQIRADSGPMTIDEKLLKALTVRGQPTSAVERFVRSLDPGGTFKIKNAHFTRLINDPATWHKELDIEVDDASILYQDFRYPLHRIHGRIVAKDDYWRLEGFEGWNDNGRIECNGEWYDRREAGVPFFLAFTAFALPMEEELQRALPIDAKQLWDQIQPSGSIDRASVRVVRPTGDAKVEVEVVLHEDLHTMSATGQSLRLRPKGFPYWTADVACDLTYRPGRLEITQATASNANSNISMRAQAEQDEHGNWIGNVHWLPSSRIMVDSQFLQALPDSVGHSLLELDLRGPINITGVTRFELPIDGVTVPTTEINLQLELEDVQLGEGKIVDGIRGSLRLAGRKDANQIVAVGWTDIAGMSVRGVPVTTVRGPVALIGNQLFFGSEVAGKFPTSSASLPIDITARALSGLVTLSGSGQLDSGRFQMKTQLENADFRCMLQDLGVSQAPTDGHCQMTLAISGVPWEPQTYNGAGTIQLREAQLYQLPTMIQLLRKLSITPTEKAAFNTADINFTIDGDRIPLSLACEGELLSLRGSGWTNFRRELDLELYSYVGSRVPVSSVLTPLIAETPYAPFMSLDVTGTLDSPRFERRAFPQLAVLQQIFPDKVARTEERTRLFERIRDRNSTDKTAKASTESGVPMYR